MAVAQGKYSMSDRIKLGLTRNRLFEFDNCVLFCGRFSKMFDESELEKSLRMLCLKEPVVTGLIELQNDGQAFVVTGEVEQKLYKTKQTKEELCKYYDENGIDFSKNVFEFSLTQDGFLVIAGHTCVCDAKALLRIASDINRFYSKKTFNVEPSFVKLVSETRDMPVEAASPIIDKLSAELDSRWLKNPIIFSEKDYANAHDNYVKSKREKAEMDWVIDEGVIASLQRFCDEHATDVSSLVGFAFYEALIKYAGGRKKYNKMNVYADQRYFFDDSENYGVGAYNGVVTSSLNSKEMSKPLEERAKLFHLSCYKGLTSPFRTFYDESLLMKVSPSMCDGAYMYKSGLLKNKGAKKLAEDYGCACEKICDYFHCNLDQLYWEDLKAYSDLNVREPLKMRSSAYLGFVRRNNKGYVTFSYKKDKISYEQAQMIMNLAGEIISKITS